MSAQGKNQSDNRGPQVVQNEILKTRVEKWQ